MLNGSPAAQLTAVDPRKLGKWDVEARIGSGGMGWFTGPYAAMRSRRSRSSAPVCWTTRRWRPVSNGRPRSSARSTTPTSADFWTRTSPERRRGWPPSTSPVRTCATPWRSGVR